MVCDCPWRSGPGSLTRLRTSSTNVISGPVVALSDAYARKTSFVSASMQHHSQIIAALCLIVLIQAMLSFCLDLFATIGLIGLNAAPPTLEPLA